MPINRKTGRPFAHGSARPAGSPVPPAKYNEGEKRRHSTDPEWRDRATIRPPRMDFSAGTQASQNGHAVPERPHEMESADDVPEAEETERHNPPAPTVRVPGHPPGGNAAFEGNEDRLARKGQGGTAKRWAPDPRVVPGFRWPTPEAEYTMSLENYGAGVTLQVLAKRWNLTWPTAMHIAKGGKLGPGGRLIREYGETWDSKRARYIQELHERTRARAIDRIADEQAELEAGYVALGKGMFNRAAAYLRKRIEEKVPLDVKDDKAFADYVDKANRVHRRNAGLPETSHEVSGRMEFVHRVCSEVVMVLAQQISDPDVLRTVHAALMSVPEKIAREEGIAAALDLAHEAARGG